MSQPGTAYLNHPYLGNDPQPAHMNQYVHMEEDNGGVHINSGIPNHAFYLAASQHGSYSWNVMGEIWFQALIQSDPEDDFSSFAQRTRAIANAQYRSTVEDSVSQAWHKVGVDLRSPMPTSPSNQDYGWFIGGVTLLGAATLGGLIWAGKR